MPCPSGRGRYGKSCTRARQHLERHVFLRGEMEPRAQAQPISGPAPLSCLSSVRPGEGEPDAEPVNPGPDDTRTQTGTLATMGRDSAGAPAGSGVAGILRPTADRWYARLYDLSRRPPAQTNACTARQVTSGKNAKKISCPATLALFTFSKRKRTKKDPRTGKTTTQPRDLTQDSSPHSLAHTRGGRPAKT